MDDGCLSEAPVTTKKLACSNRLFFLALIASSPGGTGDVLTWLPRLHAPPREGVAASLPGPLSLPVLHVAPPVLVLHVVVSASLLPWRRRGDTTSCWSSCSSTQFLDVLLLLIFTGGTGV